MHFNFQVKIGNILYFYTSYVKYVICIVAKDGSLDNNLVGLRKLYLHILFILYQTYMNVRLKEGDILEVLSLSSSVVPI